MDAVSCSRVCGVYVPGASFSAVAALQVMIRRPGTFADFVMGSPSVVFDPEVLDDLVGAGGVTGGVTGSIARGGKANEGESEGEGEGDEAVGALVLIGEKEHLGLRVAGNVHASLPDGARDLVHALRGVGVEAEGPTDVPGEDHSTVKLSLVSRGMTWVAERARRRGRRWDAGAGLGRSASASSSEEEED